MSATPVATIVHLSDLHFGDQLENREEWWHEFFGGTPLQGRFTHDYQAVQSLQLVIREICDHRAAADVPVLFVHSGDLTANGSDEEFAVGQGFLGTLGFVFDVPGNHDKWGFRAGEPQLGYLARFPSAFPLRLREGGITFFGLDSNKHSEPIWDATGMVPTVSLETLSRLMGQQHDGIRIVVIHHPIYWKGTEDARLRLDAREEIAHQLAASGADLVLSGHVHESRRYESAADRPRQFIAGSAAQLGGPKSFLVVDVYTDGFDCQEYKMGWNNQFAFVPESESSIG